jgi:hypothetical protein
MSSVTQIIFSITSFIIALSLLVGLILISISLFNIKGQLKKRNRILAQNLRPYLLIRRLNQNTLEIRNAGNTPGVLDSCDISELSNLVGQTIFAGQSYTFKSDVAETTINLSYHDQINHFMETYTI